MNLMKKLLVTLITLIALFGCEEAEQTKGDNQNLVEGIDVNLEILSNIKEIDERVVSATISNTTDKTFSGEVYVYHTSSQPWGIEVINLPKGQSITRQMKFGYIENAQDGYWIEVEGDLKDKSFESEVEFTLFDRESPRAYNVQMNEVTKENVISVVKEMYSIYGDNLNHLSFYDNTIVLEDGVYIDEFPKAEFYSNLAEKTIYVYYEDGTEEKFDFIPD